MSWLGLSICRAEERVKDIGNTSTFSFAVEPRQGVEEGNAISQTLAINHVYSNSLPPRPTASLICLKFAQKERSVSRLIPSFIGAATSSFLFGLVATYAYHQLLLRLIQEASDCCHNIPFLVTAVSQLIITRLKRRIATKSNFIQSLSTPYVFSPTFYEIWAWPVRFNRPPLQYRPNTTKYAERDT